MNRSEKRGKNTGNGGQNTSSKKGAPASKLPPGEEKISKGQKQPALKLCTKCGSTLGPDDMFCSKCGTKYVESEPPEKKEKPSKKQVETGKKKTTTVSPKSRENVPVILFIIIAAILGGLFWWYLHQPLPVMPAVVTFVINSELSKDEPLEMAIYIDGTLMKKADEQGAANFVYKEANVGDTIHVSFVKISKTRYDSQSDFDLVIDKEVMLVEHRVRFERWVPPVTWYDVNMTFKRIADFPAIIYLNNDSLFTLSANDRFTFKQRYRAEDYARLEFMVRSPGLVIQTEPEKLIYNVNRNISGTINIYALLDTTPVFDLVFLERHSKTPLTGVEVKFSDTKDYIESDEKGQIKYQSHEQRIGKQIDYSLRQTFIKPTAAIEPLMLTRETPDTIRDTLLCDVSYTIRVKVMDIDGNSISKVKVTLEGKEARTNRSGIAEFQIPRPDRFYQVDIRKVRFKPLSTTIRPLGYIHTEPITLEGTYGTLFVVDSLAEEIPVPYLSIYEGQTNVGQTGKNGKCILPILLAQPMTFVIKPTSNSIYLTKEVKITFNRPHDVIKIKLPQKPFIFHFEVRNDRGERLENVRITYSGRVYRTNKKGVVDIKRFVKQPNPQEEFEVAYYKYHDRHFVLTDPKERYYPVSIIIGSKVPVEIKTNPPSGRVVVLDMNQDIVGEGIAPLQLELEYGRYRFQATNDKGQATELILEINAGSKDEPIVLDMFNPVAQIEDSYRVSDFNRVVQIYQKYKERVHRILETQTPYRDNRCEILKHIANSFAKVSRFDEASELMGTLDRDCPQNNPYFYRNFAEILMRTEKWDQAADNYERALMYLPLIPEDSRYQFDADCHFGQAVAMLNHYQQNKNNVEFNVDACSYLDDIQEKLDYLISLAEENDLDIPEVSVNSTIQRLWETKKDCRG